MSPAQASTLVYQHFSAAAVAESAMTIARTPTRQTDLYKREPLTLPTIQTT